MRPTQALAVGRYRHVRLTTKDVGGGFYKGNRTGSMGRHTKHGGYVIEWAKVRTYVGPELKDFKVRARRFPACCQGREAAPRSRERLADDLAVARRPRPQLTPFVTRQVKAQPGDFKGLQMGPQDPYFYVEQWKRLNGVD